MQHESRAGSETKSVLLISCRGGTTLEFLEGSQMMCVKCHCEKTVGSRAVAQSHLRVFRLKQQDLQAPCVPSINPTCLSTGRLIFCGVR